jgi:biuret amidohydrolase
MQSIHGLPVATSLEEACDPRRLALLIYDMQVGICQQVSCGPPITEACRRLRDRCRAAGVPVAYSRHLSLPTHWMGPFQTRMAMAWQRVDDPDAVKPWFLRGAEGFQLVPDLAPTEDEFVFDKLAMSARRPASTEMSAALRSGRPSCAAPRVQHFQSPAKGGQRAFSDINYAKGQWPLFSGLRKTRCERTPTEHSRV